MKAQKKNFTGNDSDLESYQLVSALDEVPLWTAPFAYPLLDRIEYKRHCTLLDIGYGTGFPILELGMRLGSSGTVHGIDPWQMGTQRAAEKAEVYGIKNIIFATGHAEKLPYAKSTFDTVVSNNGINNVTSIPQVLSEVARVLKPGGQFVFTMNTERSFEEFYEVYRQVLTEFRLEMYHEKITEHIYMKRRPEPEMVSMVEDAGLRIVDIGRNSFQYRFADGNALFDHFFIRIGFLGPWKSILPVEHRDKVFARIGELLNQKAEGNGLVFTVPFLVFDTRKI